MEGESKNREEWKKIREELFLPLPQLAEEHGVKFMETSAKSGLNVETVCPILVTYVHDRAVHVLHRFIIVLWPFTMHGASYCSI